MVRGHQGLTAKNVMCARNDKYQTIMYTYLCILTISFLISAVLKLKLI